jgi:hypothetical protein
VPRLEPRLLGLLAVAGALCFAGALVAGCSSSSSGGPGGQGGEDSGPDAAGELAEGGDEGAPDGGRAMTDAGPEGGEAGLHLGVACSKTSRCVGTENVCLAAALGGYCSSFCLSDADCPQGGVCVAGLAMGPDGLPVSLCMESCATSAACAAGSFCDLSDAPAHCMPKDCRSAASVCSATQTCNQQTGTCAATPLPAGFPATFPAPAVVTSYGGPTLTAPVLVPIFFSNDSDSTSPIPAMTAFFQRLGATNYWKALSEYNIGPVASVVPVQLSQAAPASLIDDPAGNTLKPLLANLIATGAGGLPAPTPQTLYVLVFPSTTSVVQGGMTSGGNACSAFLGYHDELPLAAGGSVAYAVVLRCSASQLGYATDLDVMTSTASHEIIEAVTDPFPSSSPAYANLDAQHGLLLAANPGTELGDMCQVDPEADFSFQDMSFLVQRFWSNAAAAAGHDPCVPAYPGETYFTGVPVLPGTTSVSIFGTSMPSSSVAIPVGQSANVPVDFYSDGPTTPGTWMASVIDYQCFSGGKSPDLLSITLSAGAGGGSCGAARNPLIPCVSQACTVQNGSTITAHVTVNHAGSFATNGEPDSAEVFAVVSWQTGTTPPAQHIDFGIVSN